MSYNFSLSNKINLKALAQAKSILRRIIVAQTSLHAHEEIMKEITIPFNLINFMALMTQRLFPMQNL